MLPTTVILYVASSGAKKYSSCPSTGTDTELDPNFKLDTLNVIKSLAPSIVKISNSTMSSLAHSTVKLIFP